MEILFIIMIFFIGSVFGSFFTLAVYRIPIKQSVMYGRSYCPKCNHKLDYEFFHYNHIGVPKCSHCGFKMPESRFFASDVDFENVKLTEELRAQGITCEFDLTNKKFVKQLEKDAKKFKYFVDCLTNLWYNMDCKSYTNHSVQLIF